MVRSIFNLNKKKVHHEMQYLSHTDTATTIHSLNQIKSPDLYKLAAYYTRPASEMIAVFLSILCNCSLSLGIVTKRKM